MSNIMSLFTAQAVPASVVSGEQPATANKQPAKPDTFIDIEGLQVPDTGTVNRWAVALEKQYNVDIRPITSVGHPVNVYGCWVFEKGEKYERVRYADALQMQEIWEAHKAQEVIRFWELVEGEDSDGRTLPGPYRKDRPPVDAKGKPIEEVPSVGRFGPLEEECRWIEAHDRTILEYLGADAVWPNGCWQVDKAFCPVQHLDADGVRYVAHNILGMPHVNAEELKRQRVEIMRRKIEERRAARNGTSIASLFSPVAQPAPAPASNIAALFTQPQQPESVALPNIASLFK